MSKIKNKNNDLFIYYKFEKKIAKILGTFTKLLKPQKY